MAGQRTRLEIFMLGMAGATAFAPHALFAQSSDTPANNAAPIIVLGEELPTPPGTPAYGGVIITRDRLARTASARVEDTLKDVAGFSEFRRADSRSANPTAQGANLRSLGGNASSRTLLLLDGIPMADPFFGYIPYSAITPERLSSVRVTRGGGNGAFGAGAVAGIIEMSSATRNDLPLFAGSALYGSRDASELSATVSPDVGAGYVSLSGRWDRGDGFYTTPASQRVPATARAAYEDWSASVRAVVPVGDDMEIQARGLVYRDSRTLRFKGADSSAEGQDASIRLLSRGRWQADILAYVQARDFSNIVISSSSFRKSLDQNATPALGIGGKIELRPPVGENHVLRFGTDFRRASGDMYETAYNAGSPLNPVTARRHASGKQTTWGLFVEDDWTIGRLILTGGARADRWTITDGRFRNVSAAGVVTEDTAYADRSGWEGSFRAGAVYQASKALSLRAAAYTGFRLPTLNELYRGFVVGKVVTQANANLRPEKLKGVEAGVDMTPVQGVTLGATLFANRLEHAISNITIGDNLQQRQNVDAIVSRGVELSAAAHLGNFGISASYTYAHSRYDTPGSLLNDRWPVQSPRHSGSATLSYANDSDLYLGATVRYLGKQYEDDRNSDVLPDAWTVDAIAELPVARGISLVARGENLFDETIVTRNSGGSIDLGIPRTIWIGVKIKAGR